MHQDGTKGGADDFVGDAAQEHAAKAAAAVRLQGDELSPAVSRRFENCGRRMRVNYDLFPHGESTSAEAIRHILDIMSGFRLELFHEYEVNAGDHEPAWFLRGQRNGDDDIRERNFRTAQIAEADGRFENVLG
jgi:hypothetical protein